MSAAIDPPATAPSHTATAHTAMENTTNSSARRAPSRDRDRARPTPTRVIRHGEHAPQDRQNDRGHDACHQTVDPAQDGGDGEYNSDQRGELQQATQGQRHAGCLGRIPLR